MQINSLAEFVLLCGAMTVAIAIYAWQHRSAVGARWFAIFMLSQSVYVLGYSMELASLDVPTMLFWSKIEYIGILTFPTFFLIFVVHFIGRDRWITRRNIFLLFLIPAFLFICKLNDESLHFIYSTTGLDNSGRIPLLTFSRGPLYFVMVAYNLIVVTFGNYFLWRNRRFSSALYRRQTTIMLVAGLFIYGVYGIYLVGIEPIPAMRNLDLNPFVYTLWAVAVSWAMFRHRLFDLAPIARETLIENLSEGVIVLDAQYRVVEANPAATAIFQWKQSPIGQYAEKLLKKWIDQSTLDELVGPAKSEIRLESSGITIHYEMTISILYDKQRQKIGYLIIVHNISERKKVEEKLQELSLADELTGLTNRRGFKMLANQLINMTHRMKLNAVLIYIDLDGLKWINDNMGHSTGDKALIETAVILKNTFRASDIVARLGGDEFVILAIESVENSGEIMLARLQQQLTTVNEQANRKYRLSLSIGVSRYMPEASTSMDALLEEADTAMYEQKQAKKAALKKAAHDKK